MKPEKNFVHTLLPVSVQAALIDASMIEPRTPCALSHNRTRTLDSVTRLARMRHPHLFKREV